MSSMSCQIYFNNSTRVFYGGQLLSGRVVFQFTKPKTLRGIYVKIIGRAYCRWTTGSGHHTKTHVGEEFYLNEKTFFVGGDSGEVVLSPREYNYTFSCMLPADLPTSVEGKIGYIRYVVLVHMDRSLWSDRRFQECFTVLKALNLNEEIVLRDPLVREVRKSYSICCLLCCCTSGPLIVKGSIPVGGFVPGQIVDVFLQINNGSDQTFANFIVKIIKQIRYHTHANSSTKKHDEVVVKSASCNGCPKYQSKTYRLPITVPALPPTDESTSNIVKVSYRLQVQGSAGCLRNDPVLVFPIKIGTFPILLNHTAITQQPTVPRETLFVRLPPLPADSFPSSVPSAAATCGGDAHDIDPPTYEEAISSFSGDVPGAAFRPSYPVFRRTPSYTTKTDI
ncbi:hypothetical protein HA402_009538 [Bradysia odoriphaga]|nr:hypothetical protein HA402_009538 [Bradysia odoriphaga]